MVVRLWGQVREVKLPKFKNLKSKGKNLCASKVALVLKNLPANTGDIRDAGSILESGRSPGGGPGNPNPVSLPGESYGQRSLVGYSPQGRKEMDTTE